MGWFTETVPSSGFDDFDFSFKRELTRLSLPSADGGVALAEVTVTPAFSSRSFRARFFSFRESWGLAFLVGEVVWGTEESVGSKSDFTELGMGILDFEVGFYIAVNERKTVINNRTKERKQLLQATYFSFFRGKVGSCGIHPIKNSM